VSDYPLYPETGSHHLPPMSAAPRCQCGHDKVYRSVGDYDICAKCACIVPAAPVPDAPQGEADEAAAQIVYEAMRNASGYGNAEKYPWQAGGNSNAQEEARRVVRSVRELLAAPPESPAVTEAMVERAAEAMCVVVNGLTEKGWRNEGADPLIENVKYEARLEARRILTAALRAAAPGGADE